MVVIADWLLRFQSSKFLSKKQNNYRFSLQLTNLLRIPKTLFGRSQALFGHFRRIYDDDYHFIKRSHQIWSNQVSVFGDLLIVSIFTPNLIPILFVIHDLFLLSNQKRA